MKKMTVGLTLFFVLLAFAQVQAGITWESEVCEFRFSVDPNGGLFYDPGPPEIFHPNASDTETFTNTGGSSDSFSDIATGNLTELEGAIQLNGLAKGPDDGQSPENGALVQGFAEIDVSKFGNFRGIDVDQGVISWMTRRFRVDSAGTYYLSAYLSGTVNFNNFGTVDSSYHAVGSISGKVFLEEYREQSGAAPLKLRDVESFEWSNPTRRNGVPVDLLSDADIFYQLRVVVDIGADVQNYDWYTESISGPLTDTFEFGSADTPCEVAAIISLTAGPNTPPVADAGPNQTPDVEATVTLDGSGSFDDDGDPLTYLWSFDSKPATSAAELLGPTTVNPTFDVDVPGAYLVQLIVNDGKVDSQPSTVIIRTPGFQRMLSVEVDPVGSGSVEPDGGIYDPDTVVTLTAVPEEGFVFNEWSGDLTGTDNPATITMDADKTVTATFTEAPEQYTLTVLIDGSGGSVTLEPTGGIYDEGTQVTLTAVPDAGFVFSAWSGDLTGTDSPATITMDADKTVMASFTEAIEYTLTVLIDDGSGSSVTLEPDGGTYDEGTQVTLTAVPEEGFFFSAWSGDLTGTDSPATITMDADKTVMATFTEAVKYTLTVLIDGSGGNVTLDPTGGIYDEGTEVTLTAHPDAGMVFSVWSGDLSGSDSPATITMNANKTVMATFIDAPDQYTLTANVTPESSGTVVFDPDGGTYDADTVVTMIATAESGWCFDIWAGDVNPYAGSITTVTMDADKTVTATFFEDFNGDGIPDVQEVAGNVDLNGDGIPDIEQPDIIKSVNIEGGAFQMGVEIPEVSSDILYINSVKAVDPADISDQVNRPTGLPMGLISFELSLAVVIAPAPEVEVTVWMSEPAANNASWYKYNTAGWNNYSDSGHATFSEGRKSVVLTLMDGDYGDADGVVNGIIIDPSGPGKDRPHHDSSCCFIGTAASGSAFGGHAGILMIIAGCMLALAIGTYVTRQRCNMTQT